MKVKDFVSMPFVLGIGVVVLTVAVAAVVAVERTDVSRLLRCLHGQQNRRWRVDVSQSCRLGC